MRIAPFGKFLAACAPFAILLAAPVPMAAQAHNTILTRTDAQKLLPQSVYYKGQSAPVQGRNSGGVKFSDGYYMLAAMVDTSGYSSDVAAKYQGYFITEIPLKIGGQDLPAGIYGFGFIGGDKFVLTDVGGHDVLTANSGAGYRFYSGRKYITFTR